MLYLGGMKQTSRASSQSQKDTDLSMLFSKKLKVKSNSSNENS